jgi:phage I-like protein
MKQANKKIGMRPILLVRDFAEQDGTVPTEIHVIPVGEWDHPAYGKIVINEEDIAEFVEHFNAGLRKDLPITEGHESLDEKPAIGWFRKLLDKGAKGLYAVVEWTERGKELLMEKAYKYFSPEFYEVYEDPETHEKYTNVLVGGALTNKPYFKELEPVVFTEPQIINVNPTEMFKLSDIVQKAPAALSEDEKAFLKEHMTELTDEQKATFAEVLQETKPNAAPAKEPEKKVDATEPKDQIMISASELKVLREKANAGYEAAQNLQAREIADAVAGLTFSESNRNGKFLPKSKDKLTAFVKSLTDAQRKDFAEIIAEIPEAKLFSEIGDSNAPEKGGSAVKIEAAVQKLMSEHKGLKYADALKRVFVENPALEKEYNEEFSAA